MKQFYNDEVKKILIGLISTTLGVLIALLINSSVERSKDRKTYNTILKAINIEAVANKRISEESFRQNINRIVYREFSYKISEDFLSNRIFLNNASADLINNMNNYILNLKRANAFRNAGEKYKYDPELDKKWGDTLRIAFTKVLDNCDTSIKELILTTNSTVQK